MFRHRPLKETEQAVTLLFLCLLLWSQQGALMKLYYGSFIWPYFVYCSHQSFLIVWTITEDRGASQCLSLSFSSLIVSFHLFASVETVLVLSVETPLKFILHEQKHTVWQISHFSFIYWQKKALQRFSYYGHTQSDCTRKNVSTWQILFSVFLHWEMHSFPISVC